MLYGAILPGEQHFNKQHWAEDILNECFFDNHLWGYTIHITEELQTHDPTVFTNGVLYNLMQMGTIDWNHENNCGNQST